MARATPKLLDEDAPEPDAPAEEAPVPGYSIAMARAKAMGEVAVDNGLRFDFSARDASRRSSFSGADNGSLAAEQVLSAVAADLSLGADALSVEVQRPIFPPMPPPISLGAPEVPLEDAASCAPVDIVSGGGGPVAVQP